MSKISSPRQLQSELGQLIAYTQTEKPSRKRIASALWSLADRIAFDDAPEVLFGSSHYDVLVKNPAYLPKKLSAYYVKQFKNIGKGTKVQVVKSETTMTRGWDYGNYTLLKITLPDGEDVNAAIVINIADGEASGNVHVDSNYGGVIGLGRASSPDEAVKHMLSDAIPHLSAVWGRRTAASDTPEEVKELAKAVHNHQLEDPNFTRSIGRLGWKKSREVPYSGAWWVAKGNLEVLITFGGPKKDARVSSWRLDGGPAATV